MKRITTLIFLIAIASLSQAQNPFKDIGIPDDEIPIGTLSDGQFEEFHDQERYVQIGSVLFDTETMTIAAVNYRDTVYSEATMEPEVISRWLSGDPLRQYASPYVGMGNDPVNRVDPDGGWDKYKMDQNGNITLSEVTIDNYDELYASNGDLIAGGIRKGVLQDGQNFLLGFNLIDLTFDELSMDITHSGSAQSFVLQLSQYFEKEIGGFQIIDSEGTVKLFTLPFAENTFSNATSIRKFRFGEYGNTIRYSNGNWLFRNFNFKMVSWFHTHPGKQGEPWAGDAFNTGGLDGNDQEYTNYFNVQGHIYGGKGNYNTLFPQH